MKLENLLVELDLVTTNVAKRNAAREMFMLMTSRSVTMGGMTRMLKLSAMS